MRYLLLLGTFAACTSSGKGDPSAFIGVYKTTAHTSVAMLGVDCTSAGQPVTNGDPYFKLSVDTFFSDASELDLSGCTDAAGATCVTTATTMMAGGPGLQTISANSQTGGGQGCQLHWSSAEATLTGMSIHIVLLEKYTTPNLSDADCTYDAAAALASQPTCSSVEHWDGTRQ